MIKHALYFIDKREKELTNSSDKGMFYKTLGNCVISEEFLQLFKSANNFS